MTSAGKRSVCLRYRNLINYQLALSAIKIPGERTVHHTVAYHGINAVAHYVPTAKVVGFRPIEEIHDESASNPMVAEVVGEAVLVKALQRWLVAQL